MNTSSILLVALGLALDSFTASLFCGLQATHIRKTATKVGIFFGFFHGYMIALGGTIGLSFRPIIAQVDYIIAFILLFAIGLNYIKESKRKNIVPHGIISLKVLLTLSFATSIDALAAGITITVLETNLLYPIIVVSLTTFILSYLGVIMAERFNHYFKLHDKIGIIGGLILIGMGIKILLEHMIDFNLHI